MANRYHTPHRTLRIKADKERPAPGKRGVDTAKKLSESTTDWPSKLPGAKSPSMNKVGWPEVKNSAKKI